MANIKANLKTKTSIGYDKINLSSESDLISYRNTTVKSICDEVVEKFGLETSNTTVFNTDGSISQTDSSNKWNITTTFNTDGSITEVLTYTDVNGVIKIKTKTTTFNSDGSINEVIS